jgi:hypothetical protein
MPPLSVLFADEIYEYLEPVVEKVHSALPLPEGSTPPLLKDDYAAYAMLGLGALFLLVFLWRLLTLRIFRAIFALIAVALVSYYPLAYGVHYWWFTKQAPTMEGREAESWEKFITDDWKRTDYIIMAAGGVLGLLILWLSGGRKKKDYAAEETSAQPHQAGRPGQKNPFDFG